MLISWKDELTIWSKALVAFDDGNVDDSIKHFKVCLSIYLYIIYYLTSLFIENSTYK